MVLTGRRILITRTRQQASELAMQLEAEGAETILIPTIELVPPTSFDGLDVSLASLQDFDWIIFTSANAVHAFDARARALGIVPLANKVAVIGPSTARALQQIGLTPDLIPPKFVAESFADALEPFAAGASMLLICAEQARDVLPETLTAAGAVLTVAHAYRNHIPLDSDVALRQVFADPQKYPDAITFTSSSTAMNLIAMLENASLKLPDQIVRASIGPITSQTLRELGYPASIEASEPTVASLCFALMECFREGA